VKGFSQLLAVFLVFFSDKDIDVQLGGLLCSRGLRLVMLIFYREIAVTWMHLVYHYRVVRYVVEGPRNV
jgi:hypothetical protein